MALDLIRSTYNPDVLTCLANLSSDEVFTPPEVVNQMLDMLPQELFSNPDTTFLDPATKSGVFLREIAKRLMKGLEQQIPDLQERVDHIFQKQLFGIAMTELTSLMARRSLYCSKYPNSSFSVTKFHTPEGNIRFRQIRHTWVDGKCAFCAASQSEYDRSSDLESHAYELIHTNNQERIFNMKFDVIISNPPYQLNDGGAGKSAKPIYQHFVTAAKKLQPRFISMIIPARWFSAGKDVNDFRDDMLHDQQLRKIVDYHNAGECFSGVDIKGGVCYFLWERGTKGQCVIESHKSDGSVSTATRSLLENGLATFIRDNELISIFHKVRSYGEKTIDSIISPRDPFGYDIREENSLKTVPHKYVLTKNATDNIEFYYNGWRKAGVGYVPYSSVRDRTDWVGKYKVLIPNAWGSGDTYKDRVKPFIVGPNAVCTETYLVVGPFDTQNECENVVSYINTKFFHALVSLIKISQHATKTVYQLVPMQDFSQPWNDAKLYSKYGFSDDEIKCVEDAIRSLDGVGGDG